MSPMIDATAHAPISIEAPAGISESAWYRAASSSSGVDVGAAFGVEDFERDIVRSHRIQDAQISAVMQRLESLLRLAPGWNSYGAPKISQRAAQSAIVFLMLSRSTSTPSVVPTANGGVQIEWHLGDVDVEIECIPSGDARLFAEDRTSGKLEERWVVPGHPAVEMWLRRLGVRR